MKMYADILAVGIPASLEQLIMAILAIIVNFLLTVVAGTTAVAVYTAGWRIISVGIIPAVGVGTAAVTVAGVSYGARNYDKIKTTVRYAVKLGFIVSLITCILIHVFAGQIAYIFSYSSNSSQLAPLITKFPTVNVFICIVCTIWSNSGKCISGTWKRNCFTWSNNHKRVYFSFTLCMFVCIPIRSWRNRSIYWNACRGTYWFYNRIYHH